LARVNVENLQPYNAGPEYGEAAFFNANKWGSAEGIARAIAILLWKNAGGVREIYKDGSTVGFSNTNGKRFKIVVVDCTD
jgi:hypothetical protein